jgi:trehalose 6-phosphate phosphatase
LPNAIHSAELIRKLLGSEPMMLFDFDGTLSPIVDHHEDARISEPVRQLLKELGTRFVVGVVSGRGALDVRQKVGISGLIYAGSHGQEIEVPGQPRYEHPESLRLKGELDAATGALESRLAHLSGVAIERKPFAVAVHTRQAFTDTAREEAVSVVEEMISDYPGLVVRSGKEVVEMTPATQWNKGNAVEFLCDAMGGRVPLFMGDDITDEDGFQMANDLGGVSIVVAPTLSRPTAAQFALDDTDAVEQFLSIL